TSPGQQQKKKAGKRGRISKEETEKRGKKREIFVLKSIPWLSSLTARSAALTVSASSRREFEPE
ncbi:hypothetical protein BaRGS_00039510, partial [Batillaria attramentaria]